jgi:hypothetical protein
LLILQDPCAFTFKLGKPEINVLIEDIKLKFDQHIADCRLEPDDYVTVVTGCTLTGDYYAALIKPQDNNAGFLSGHETKTLLFGAHGLPLFHYASQLVIQTNGHRHVATDTDCEGLGCSSNKNQCIFLNALCIKRRKRSQNFKIRAAAEPEDLDKHNFDRPKYGCTLGIDNTNTNSDGDEFELTDECGNGTKKVRTVCAKYMAAYCMKQDTWNIIFDWLFAVRKVPLSNLVS